MGIKMHRQRLSITNAYSPNVRRVANPCNKTLSERGYFACVKIMMSDSVVVNMTYRRAGSTLTLPRNLLPHSDVETVPNDAPTMICLLQQPVLLDYTFQTCQHNAWHFIIVTQLTLSAKCIPLRKPHTEYFSTFIAHDSSLGDYC